MSASESLPVLHGSNISPYVRKVRVALAFKAIEYRGIQQSPFNASDEFKAKSPLSKIPCWEDGDLVLPDSSVIVGYLEHRYPSPSLFPDNPEERARALWFEEYADTISLNSSVSRPSDSDCYWVKSSIETNLSPTKEPM